MMMKTISIVALSMALFMPAFAADDPLPSWNDGSAKASIIAFVEKVTQADSPEFVPVPERIATFDNDGCLWSEQPMYFQAFFIFDRIKELASQHPEWETQEPFASVLKGDLKAAMAGGEHGLMEMAMATHAGMNTEAFAQIVSDWIATARHPTTGKLYTEMVYQPMLEVLAYLRDNGFKTYIVSGGGIEFMRPWTERVYGIPPEQVVGSSIKTQFELQDGVPVLMRLPEMNFIDDKEGKPVAIHQHIGRRPIAAFGNSDGDLQMLQWTSAGEGLRFCLYVHHTDGEREWAYDRESHVGRLDKGLDEAMAKGWTVADMKMDWNRIYPDAPAVIPANPLMKTSWLVEDLGGQGVIDYAQTTIRFDEAAGVSGSTGCNRYTGSVKMDGAQLSFGPMASTRMACPEAVMDQEQRFESAMGRVKTFALEQEDAILNLLDEGGDVVVRASRMIER
ncbi:MAG: META domain-containing protein [Verrucomicrobia bacterium]|nr:META domain-containing protein [Verrucomicrobiota bacterium]